MAVDLFVGPVAHGTENSLAVTPELAIHLVTVALPRHRRGEGMIRLMRQFRPGEESGRIIDFCDRGRCRLGDEVLRCQGKP